MTDRLTDRADDSLTITEVQVALQISRTRAVHLACWELDGQKVKGRWRVPRASLNRWLATMRWPPGVGSKLADVYSIRNLLGHRRSRLISRAGMCQAYVRRVLFASDESKPYQQRLTDLASATISAAYAGDWRRFDALEKDLFTEWFEFEAVCGPFPPITQTNLRNSHE